MPASAISVESLGKAYRIGLKEEIPDTLVSAATSWLKAPMRNFHRLRKLNTFRTNSDAEEDIIWALRDVSFEVPEGEVLGIIGRNGAGKSTLLKILSRITEPTAGRAVIRGRVSSLLEVGTGFHPELSGRENIYMNGTILGMRKKEIDRKLDEIIDFSGVEKFLDTPIKRYSSGMKVRLAFAVAAHLEPEILIIDEVLAVGDAEFQKKCLGKMDEVAKGGRTVLFVSHNMAAVESLCTRVIELSAGTVEMIGGVEEVISDYRSKALARSSIDYERKFLSTKLIKNVQLLDTEQQPTSYLRIGSEFHLRIDVDAQTELRNPTIGVGIDSIDGQRNLTCLTPIKRNPFGLVSGRTAIDCRVHHLPLRPGQYSVKVAVAEGPVQLETVDEACQFTIADGDLFNEGRGFKRGVCVARADWSIAQYS